MDLLQVKKLLVCVYFNLRLATCITLKFLCYMHLTFLELFDVANIELINIFKSLN